MTRVKLQYLSAAKASGEDAGSFLQAQLTADLTRLSAGDACFSAYCDPAGNVLAVLRVIRRGDDYLLIAAAALMESLLAVLGKYVLRARVKLEPTVGTVVGVDDAGALDYTLEPAESVDASTASQDVGAWRARELRSGIVWLRPETSGQFLPQMLGLERLGAVSFRKGCFPGQEVIARVRYLGRLKRRPLIAEAEGRLDIAPGDEVELLGAGGTVGSAVLVDVAFGGDATTLFMVARNRKEDPVRAILYAGKRVPLREAAQA